MRRLIPAITAVLLTTACASTATHTATPPASTAPTPSASPSATAATSAPASAATQSPSSSPSPTAAIPADTTLKAALLTAGDLGPAFTQATDTSDSGNGSFSGCKPLADLLNAGSAPHQVSANYEAGTSSGPYIDETLTPGAAGDLQTTYSATKTALTSCKTVTFTSSGTAVVFDLTPINFGGPNSAAVRMDGTLQGVQLNGYLVIDQVPSALLGFFYFQVAGGSSQLADAFHAKALSKAQQTLGMGASPASAAS